MNLRSPVAIVGAGPAGSSLARRLAASGVEVLLFHAPTRAEKHCGGGIPARTFDEFPWLDELAPLGREIRLITIIPPRGSPCNVALTKPVMIFTRRVFDDALRAAALAAGARIVAEQVRSVRIDGTGWLVRTDVSEHRAAFLVGADGVTGVVRRAVAERFAPSALSLCAGYYFDPPDDEKIVIGFLIRKASYAWIFPRPDAASAGIGAPLVGSSAQALRQELREWLRTIYPGHPFDFSRSYASLVPTYTGKTKAVCGKGWALVGDAAGVAEPVTREGIYFSIKSSELLAAALMNGQPEEYVPSLAECLYQEHRHALFIRKYLFRPLFTESVIRLMTRSTSARSAMQRFFSATLRYGPLGRELLRSFHTS
jgi:flavin-dependent dehydrogenase